ncbi:hypothetical protein PUN28_002796 [Cardiocondyla obscurior]|uniref:Uncharacterized protein n=1 Tax=Cardiocondyla obscurior TaxID=286306 RepID=A0AAW2GW66_9HYME
MTIATIYRNAGTTGLQVKFFFPHVQREEGYACCRTRCGRVVTKTTMVCAPSISSEFNQRHNEWFIVAPRHIMEKKKNFFPARRELAGRVEMVVRNNDASMALL